ncbi:MAG: hypothetical protein IKP40_05165 [Clostridia bacterium]|nr:hypothetical protein [Clostridia bacterium]
MNHLDSALLQTLLAGLGAAEEGYRQLESLGGRLVRRGEEVMGASGVRNEPLKHSAPDSPRAEAPAWLEQLSDRQLALLSEAIQAEVRRRATDGGRSA